MRFVAKYNINLTIEEDDLVNLTEEARKRKENHKIGDFESIKGTKEEIKRQIDKKIDEFAESLEKWYYSEEE